jgi:hypothetical protein
MTSRIFEFCMGLLFGIGLILSGMTDPGKVKAFLDLAGAWDPSLALVMGGAIAVGVGAFAWARQRQQAWLGGAMRWPERVLVDRWGTGSRRCLWGPWLAACCCMTWRPLSPGLWLRADRPDSRP